MSYKEKEILAQDRPCLLSWNVKMENILVNKPFMFKRSYCLIKDSISKNIQLESLKCNLIFKYFMFEVKNISFFWKNRDFIRLFIWSIASDNRKAQL